MAITVTDTLPPGLTGRSRCRSPSPGMAGLTSDYQGIGPGSPKLTFAAGQPGTYVYQAGTSCASTPTG